MSLTGSPSAPVPLTARKPLFIRINILPGILSIFLPVHSVFTKYKSSGPDKKR